MQKTIIQPQNFPIYSFPLLFIYCLLGIFIIPTGTFSYAVYLLPTILVAVLYEVLTERIKFQLSDFFITFSLLFCTFAYNYSRDKFATALGLIALLMICRFPQSLNPKKFYPFYLISLSGIIYQLFNYQHPSGVSVLSNGDPNFSAYMMLLFFMFSFKNRYMIGMILSLSCSFIFFSRAYFLSLLILGIIGFIESKLFKIFPKKIRRVLPKKIPVLWVTLFLNGLLIFYSIYYINLNRLNDAISNLNRRDVNRLVRIDDNSNYMRWLGNQQAFELLSNNPEIRFFGLQEKHTITLNKLTTAHNSLLSIVLYKGLLFSLIFFMGVGTIIKRIYQPQNVKYLLAAIFFSFFLHSLFDGILGIFLIAILTLKPYNGKFMF